MLLRRLARAGFASWFVSEGLSVVRRPSTHVVEARGALDTARRRAPDSVRVGVVRGLLDRPPTDRQLTAVVRVHGALLAAAGAALATGRAPRTAALALAVLTAPLVVLQLPRKPVDGEVRLPRGERRERFVRTLAFTAGAVLVAVDREGRPSLRWQVRHTIDERASRRASGA